MVIKQQLTQASKMATLGEMATGIAHELNQPLSVIKTASSFLLTWLRKGERPTDEVLRTMLEENVVKAAGTSNCTTEEELRRIIRDAGFRPAQRDTLYRTYFLN